VICNFVVLLGIKRNLSEDCNFQLLNTSFLALVSEVSVLLYVKKSEKKSEIVRGLKIASN
jgi:hypothetical protein